MPSVKQRRNAGRMRFSEPASVRPLCITPHLGHTTAIASITLPHAWQYFVGRVSVWLLLMDGILRDEGVGWATTRARRYKTIVARIPRSLRYQAVSRDARSASRSGSRTGSAAFWPTLS